MVNKWHCPCWMERYRGLFFTGHYTLEELMNADLEANQEPMVRLKIIAVAAQVRLLTDLAREGKLTGVSPRRVNAACPPALSAAG